MHIKSKVLVAVAATWTLAVGGLGLAAGTAEASTLKCTATESCGGADLAYAGHGALSLAVLNPDSTINGGFGYNNEEVGFTTAGASNGSQDFTVLQDASETNGHDANVGLGGTYGHGNYVAMYTPGGVRADTTKGQLQYCVSVEDTYPTVGGKTVQQGIQDSCRFARSHQVAVKWTELIGIFSKSIAH